LTAERHALQGTVQDCQKEVVNLIKERDALPREVRDRENEVVHLTKERDALREELQRLAEVARELGSRSLLVTPPPEPAPPASAPSRSGRSLIRRLALIPYWFVRPVVRPLMWRFRGFMTNGLAEQMRALNDRIEALAASAGAPLSGLEALNERIGSLAARLDADRSQASVAVEEMRLLGATVTGSSNVAPAVARACADPVLPTLSKSSMLHHPSTGTLADLDALNAEYADRPLHDRLRAVGQFLLKVEGAPLDDARDPFGLEYYDRVVQFWGSISGRADYNPQRDERAPYVDSAASLLSPAFYASGDSRHAGEFLAGIGFILQQLDVRKGDSLLEYGAGEGQIALHVARLGCQVSVIDIEPRYLEGILLQARAIGADISVQEGMFGDGFADGRRFDRILFFEAFHHALDHARVLRQLHDRLKPGGRIVFASEPVILPDGGWTHVVPYPWGSRLDGRSVNAMRTHGWCELGFREDYFVELLMRTGYLCTFHPCPATAIGTCFIARPHYGCIDMGEPFLIRVTGRDSGWHTPESGQRYTREHALPPLDANSAVNGILVDFFNFLPIARDIIVRLSSTQHAVSFAPGERRTVPFEVPTGTQWFEILSPTDCLAQYVGEHDQRVVGIGVRRVTYAGAIIN
jgi:2-polyprenyl-3-methyl-5-hydroxy-6-metoxy-1,4-benzoquinol methylase